MTNNNPILSLCIPTNGVTEWVIPVLNSIYSQNVTMNNFEVIVTDNGNNKEFKTKIREYVQNYNNLIYQENDTYMFYNQLESLKLAKGQYLKFINHRSILEDGALQKMISIVQENMKKKPTLFFSNGVLNKSVINCSSFDEFVSELGRYASWTTGVGIWKEDYTKIRDNLVVDSISPHSCILFSKRDDDLYRIYDFTFSHEITGDHSKKGTYDLFKAFGIEELAITQNLYINGSISINTFKKVKDDYEKFLCKLYFDYCIRKRPCSYDLSGFNDAMGIYFIKRKIVIGAYIYGIHNVINKIILRRREK